MGGESQSHHRNRGPRFADECRLARAGLWTIPRAAETPRSVPFHHPETRRPSGPLQLPTPSLAPRPHSAPLSSRSLHWLQPPVSSVRSRPLPREPAVSPATPPPRQPGLTQVESHSLWASAAATPGPKTPARGGGSGWAGACSTSDTRGREGGGRARFIIGRHLQKLLGAHSLAQSPRRAPHRRATHARSPEEPRVLQTLPPAYRHRLGQGTSPLSQWGFCPITERARAAAPPRSQPQAALARSSATLR